MGNFGKGRFLGSPEDFLEGVVPKAGLLRC